MINKSDLKDISREQLEDLIVEGLQDIDLSKLSKASLQTAKRFVEMELAVSLQKLYGDIKDKKYASISDSKKTVTDLMKRHQDITTEIG